MRTEQELIDEAEACQNACNLSGVVYCFNEAITELWDIANKENKSTSWVNTHRMSKLFASKIVSLTGEL